jgi:Fe-S cluster biogenesis protein NfuA
MNYLDGREFQARLERLDALLREAESLADPAARSRLQEVVRAVLDLHGAALARLLEHVSAAGDAGQSILSACAGDDVVTGLLLLHDLHPLDLETRVRQALESVRPYLRSHGGNVELLEVNAGVVRLRLDGSCESCPSSAITMRQTIEGAVYARAPEVETVELEPSASMLSESTNGHIRMALPIV